MWFCDFQKMWSSFGPKDNVPTMREKYCFYVFAENDEIVKPYLEMFDKTSADHIRLRHSWSFRKTLMEVKLTCLNYRSFMCEITFAFPYADYMQGILGSLALSALMFYEKTWQNKKKSQFEAEGVVRKCGLSKSWYLC